MPRYRVGIDTGGTFTDVVAVDNETGLMSATKTPSSPDDPSRSLAAGLDKIMGEVGGGRADLEALIHGTTVATNALLEERFSSLALVTTAGFRNILEIARQSVPSGYGNSYFWVKPDRIVPLERVFEVHERLNFRGDVLRPLEEEGVRSIARRLRDLGVEAVAVSLLHSYANPHHEQRVGQILSSEYPELVVSLSSDVLPEYREYERTMTTCVDAYVKPVMERYIGRAVDGLGFTPSTKALLQANSGPELRLSPAGQASEPGTANPSEAPSASQAGDKGRYSSNAGHGSAPGTGIASDGPGGFEFPYSDAAGNVSEPDTASPSEAFGGSEVTYSDAAGHLSESDTRNPSEDPKDSQVERASPYVNRTGESPGQDHDRVGSSDTRAPSTKLGPDSTDVAGPNPAAIAPANGHTPFLIMQSNGGVLSAAEVARQPITTLLSGPAAGALGAGYLAGLGGYDRVLTVDAGGTSTDICLVDNGVPHVTTEGRVGRFPVKVPMVDVTTIGTGGGSIAWIDPSGGLRVGPKSAGAAPGPMCYGRGGTEPTLTDANVALGRLPPFLLGGEIPLDVDASWHGLTRLADRLGLTVEKLAAGVVEIADWNQVHAIRQVTVKKGLDPRSYTMVAFGGSGPLQAPHVAELLNVDTVLIPPNPGNVSAFGLLAVDLKTDYVVTSVHREDRVDLAAINESFSRLESRAGGELDAEKVPVDRRRLARSADLRYFGEAYEVRIEVPAGDIVAATVTAMTERFHAEHDRIYGYSYRGDQLCEIVNLRVSAIGLVDRPRLQPAAGGPAHRPVDSDAEDASGVKPHSYRPVYLGGSTDARFDNRDFGLRDRRDADASDAAVDGRNEDLTDAAVDGRNEGLTDAAVDGRGAGFRDVPVYKRDDLGVGFSVTGPAIVEEYGSTSIVPPGWSVEVDAWSNLILRRQTQ